ncbi:Anaphase promoting complex 11 (Apc11/Cdc27) [Blastocystis sp. ATCC 50177/Nand II]|uniref:Anaphase promoting complex 11 (Apc11/Cdc27) n=1 Tax=Blastocystis sp. subtype 1 (strain ATCC 50177 / NandII) TaxID=478820 RepID=A0A196SAC3_BLAHN|nr:Anaphase promoting complex 11 (Apc11/Cdc27) [Blastocystis sp. ATCC 50177/Nand II]
MEVEKADKQEGRFKLKEWNSVVMWSWNTDVDTCAICRSKLMTLCIDCQAKVNSGEKGECKVAWGACNHAFHAHCINRWLQTKKECPLDMKPWVLKKTDSL